MNTEFLKVIDPKAVFAFVQIIERCNGMDQSSFIRNCTVVSIAHVVSGIKIKNDEYSHEFPFDAIRAVTLVAGVLTICLDLDNV